MEGHRVPNRASDQALEVGARTILGRPLIPDESGGLHKYQNLLIKWNKVHRLVGSSRLDWLVTNIILDSLLFSRVLPAHATDVADLGSGAGVPGVPLALVRRDLQITLIESRHKRASFLATVIRELGLSHVRVVAERAEDAPGLAGRFDVVVSRCAGGRNVISVGRALLRPGGTLTVAGPPQGGMTGSADRVTDPEADWVTVSGVDGRPRRFAVYRKPT